MCVCLCVCVCIDNICDRNTAERRDGEDGVYTHTARRIATVREADAGGAVAANWPPPPAPQAHEFHRFSSCVSECVCVCVLLYFYTHTHIHKHTHINIYIYVYVYM